MYFLAIFAIGIMLLFLLLHLSGRTFPPLDRHPPARVFAWTPTSLRATSKSFTKETRNRLLLSFDR
jgi:hypothetical protein